MATYREKKISIEHKREYIFFFGGGGGYARVVLELAPDYLEDGSKKINFVLAPNEVIKASYKKVCLNKQCDAEGNFVKDNNDITQVLYVKMSYPEFLCPPQHFPFKHNAVSRPCFCGFDNEHDIHSWYPRTVAMENQLLKIGNNDRDEIINQLTERNQILIYFGTELARRENRFKKVLKGKAEDDEEESQNKELEGGNK